MATLRKGIRILGSTSEQTNSRADEAKHQMVEMDMYGEKGVTEEVLSKNTPNKLEQQKWFHVARSVP